MLKITLSFACGAVLSLALYLLVFDRPVTAPPLEISLGLADSYDQLVDSLAQAGDFVESHPWYGSEREQAEAYRHIMRTLVAAIPILGSRLNHGVNTCSGVMAISLGH